MRLPKKNHLRLSFPKVLIDIGLLWAYLLSDISFFASNISKEAQLGLVLCSSQRTGWACPSCRRCSASSSNLAQIQPFTVATFVLDTCIEISSDLLKHSRWQVAAAEAHGETDLMMIVFAVVCAVFASVVILAAISRPNTTNASRPRDNHFQDRTTILSKQVDLIDDNQSNTLKHMVLRVRLHLQASKSACGTSTTLHTQLINAKVRYLIFTQCSAPSDCSQTRSGKSTSTSAS